MQPTLRQPTLFVSHGAPTMALEPGAAGAALSALGKRLPRPSSILIISPHWDSPSAVVSSAVRPQTIHDFHGFPAPLYELRYPASGAPAMAQRVTELLQAAGIPCASDPMRGLDHGAWSPLRFLFPEADIPAAQLSLQSQRDPSYQVHVGRALAPLRDENVLIIGSGSMTHNLSEFRGKRFDSPPQPYVTEFQEWFARRIGARNLEELMDYRRLAPNAARAHPEDEHLLPLFIAMGANGESRQVERLVDEVIYGMLAMDAYIFH
ncbi:MAG: dioxygenase [Betaproteobacteria bacterium]|nr:dioxygenase [Betaproteobacteria bacterium]